MFIYLYVDPFESVSCVMVDGIVDELFYIPRSLFLGGAENKLICEAIKNNIYRIE